MRYRWKALGELFRSNRVGIGSTRGSRISIACEGSAVTLRAALLQARATRNSFWLRSLSLVRAWNPVVIGTRADPEHPRAAMPSLIHPSRPPTRTLPALTAWIALPACPSRIFYETGDTALRAPSSTCTSWSQVLILTSSAHFLPDPSTYPLVLSAHARKNWNHTSPVYLPFSCYLPLSCLLALRACGR